jgi:hypothetical protein
VFEFLRNDLLQGSSPEIGSKHSRSQFVQNHLHEDDKVDMDESNNMLDVALFKCILFVARQEAQQGHDGHFENKRDLDLFDKFGIIFEHFLRQVAEQI